MTQVQLRVPEHMIKLIDLWVKQGRFQSRSEAIKFMIAEYQEREKTREFYKMLIKRSKEAKEKPDILISISDIK
ncbi:MAG: ribbon-helix-helix protein, CopG family [Nanoarchaeota archaeon]|nr:ribbon-helix-helix protein, CopG family [Nanoarchaeota archaeon]